MTSLFSDKKKNALMCLFSTCCNVKFMNYLEFIANDKEYYMSKKSCPNLKIVYSLYTIHIRTSLLGQDMNPITKGRILIYFLDLEIFWLRFLKSNTESMFIWIENFKTTEFIFCEWVSGNSNAAPGV